MAEPNLPDPAADPRTLSQSDLPGIPRSSTLNDLLAGYGLALAEAPDGLRRQRHELQCGNLRGIAEIWILPDGTIDSFRIWSKRPRTQRKRIATPGP